VEKQDATTQDKLSALEIEQRIGVAEPKGFHHRARQFLRRYTQPKIEKAIRENATYEVTYKDGSTEVRVDGKLASYIEMKMSQAEEKSIVHALNPSAWVGALVGLSRFAFDFKNNYEQKNMNLGSAMRHTIGLDSRNKLINAAFLAGGFGVDFVRMKWHIDGALNDELRGALRSEQLKRLNKDREEGNFEMRHGGNSITARIMAEQQGYAQAYDRSSTLSPKSSNPDHVRQAEPSNVESASVGAHKQQGELIGARR